MHRGGRLPGPGLLLRTLAPLGPSRVFRRVMRPLRGGSRRALLASGLHPRQAALRPLRLEPALPSGVQWDGSRRFRFLEVEHDLGNPPRWKSAPSRLWGYHLHYLDALRDPRHAPTRRLELLEAWVRGNPPGVLPGWEPYPVSIRLVNAFELLAASHPEPPAEVLRSLALQAWWLAGGVEWDVGANHLWKNGVALAWAGRLLDAPEAADWRRAGDSIVLDALERQILPDGFHYELTPSYHAILVEDLLRLLALLRATGEEHARIGEAVRSALAKTARALASVLHPDGEIPLFNDSAFGQAPPVVDLLGAVTRWVDAAPPVLEGATAAGLHRLAGEHSVLIVDAGPTACDDQPGHAHADSLSFELSAFGARVVVDAGVFDYEASPERRYARGTAAHNTVEVDGRDQSEVWGSFRLGRRARILSLDRSGSGGMPYLEAAHDGYGSLPGRPIHRRRVGQLGGDAWRIVDVVEGRGEHAVASRVRLHPDLDVALRPDGSVLAAGELARCRVMPEEGATLRLEGGWYFPRMGRKEPCRVVRVDAGGSLPLRLAYRLELSSRS